MEQKTIEEQRDTLREENEAAESLDLNEFLTGSGIIDNRRKINGKKVTLKDVLKQMAESSKGIKCAVGYFYISGIAEIIYSLKDLKEIKILMGSETDIPTKNALIRAFKKDLEKLDISQHEGAIALFYTLVNNKNIQIRVYFGKEKPQKLHAKAYLLFRELETEHIEDRYKYGIIGSSNLSHSGLTENTELNIILRENRDMKYLEDWFDTLWKMGSEDFEGLDVREQITKAIKESKFKETVQNLFQYIHPRDFFKMLIKYLNADYLFEGYKKSNLLKFQYVDFIRILNNFNSKKYRGTFLTSSVGLGKSYVAAQVAKYFIDNGKKVLVIAPAGLVRSEDQWPRYLKEFNIYNEVKLLSMGELQKHPDKFKHGKFRGYGLVIVDEVHNFRNTDSYRTRNLKKIIDKNANAKTLFLSATPINTDLEDLLRLIDLFRRKGENRLFDKLVTDLDGIIKIFKNKKYEELTKKEKERLVEIQERIEKELFVKSTRETIKTSKDYIEELKTFAGIDITQIPDPRVEEIEYSLHKSYKTVIGGIVDFIDSLSAAHLRLLDPERGERLRGIFKWLLYKRFESDITSYYTTLKRISKKNKIILNAVNKRDISILSEDESDDYINISFDTEFRVKLKEIIDIIEDGKGKRHLDVLKDLEQDIKIIDDEIDKLKPLLEKDSEILFRNDKKIESLADIIETNKEKKILIFTEYSDTLMAIKEYMGVRVPKGRIAFVDSKIKNKENIISHFNDTKDELRVIVSTDTLSEGYNISGADIVVNFDIPYNPVKIIQRIGRATRLDNPKEIEIMNFRPAEDIDVELKLVEKLELRIKDIIRFIGVEYRIWFEVEEEILKKRREMDKRIYLDILDKIRTDFRTTKMGAIETPIEYSRPILIFLQKAISKYGIKKEEISGLRIPKGNNYTLLKGEKGIMAISESLSYNEEILIGREIEEIKSSVLFEKEFSDNLKSLEKEKKTKKREEIELEYRTDTMDRDINTIIDYIDSNDLSSAYPIFGKLKDKVLEAKTSAGSETEKSIRKIKIKIKKERDPRYLEELIKNLENTFREKTESMQTKILEDDEEKKKKSTFVIAFKEE